MGKIIGIDLGHCETAAAYLLRTDTEQGDAFEVRRLAASSDRDLVVLTQMILTEEQMRTLQNIKQPSYSHLKQLGTIQIGNHLPYYIESGERLMYFKASPEHFDELCSDSELVKETGFTHGMAMACYLYALINNILEYSGDFTQQDRGSLELLIGCPTTSAWTSSKMQRRYADLAKRATGVKSVRIVPESRAAMYSCLGKGSKTKRVSAANGAAVFDFGSSTADFTYMHLGKTLIEFSWTLGAYIIERNMTLRALKKAMQLSGNMALQPDEESMVKNENDLRAAKEAYFNNEYGPKGHRMVCSFEDRSSGEETDAVLRVDSGLMKSVISEDTFQIAEGSRRTSVETWEEACRSFFQEAKAAIDRQKEPLGTIVLTGGACKMDFIVSLCHEVFPEIMVLRDNNPAYSVSNGLAWVAATDEKVSECQSAAKAEVKKQLTASVKKFKNEVMDAIYEEITKKSLECVNTWAFKDNDTETVRNLQKSMEEEIQKEAFQKVLTDICDEKIAAFKEELSGIYEKAINTQVARLYSEEIAGALMLPKDVLREVSSDAIFKDGKLDTATFVNSIDMTPLVRKTLGYVLMTVIVIAGAAIGQLIGAIIGVILAAFADAFIKDDDLDKPRKKYVRQKAAKQLQGAMKDVQIKSKIMGSFATNIDKSMENYETRSEEIIDRAFAVMMMTYFENKIES
ncbi:MAG: hypothetical protein LUI87_15565 [Lachnospiraceae bacterium]|nr:hypothetical protein [Lachnospiraceae bacterium]